MPKLDDLLAQYKTAPKKPPIAELALALKEGLGGNFNPPDQPIFEAILPSLREILKHRLKLPEETLPTDLNQMIDRDCVLCRDGENVVYFHFEAGRLLGIFSRANGQNWNYFADEPSLDAPDTLQQFSAGTEPKSIKMAPLTKARILAGIIQDIAPSIIAPRQDVAGMLPLRSRGSAAVVGMQDRSGATAAARPATSSAKIQASMSPRPASDLTSAPRQVPSRELGATVLRSTLLPFSIGTNVSPSSASTGAPIPPPPPPVVPPLPLHRIGGVDTSARLAQADPATEAGGALLSARSSPMMSTARSAHPIISDRPAPPPPPPAPPEHLVKQLVSARAAELSRTIRDGSLPLPPPSPEGIDSDAPLPPAAGSASPDARPPVAPQDKVSTEESIIVDRALSAIRASVPAEGREEYDRLQSNLRGSVERLQPQERTQVMGLLSMLDESARVLAAIAARRAREAEDAAGNARRAEITTEYSLKVATLQAEQASAEVQAVSQIQEFARQLKAGRTSQDRLPTPEANAELTKMDQVIDSALGVVRFIKDGAEARLEDAQNEIRIQSRILEQAKKAAASAEATRRSAAHDSAQAIGYAAHNTLVAQAGIGALASTSGPRVVTGGTGRSRSAALIVPTDAPPSPPSTPTALAATAEAITAPTRTGASRRSRSAGARTVAEIQESVAQLKEKVDQLIFDRVLREYNVDKTWKQLIDDEVAAIKKKAEKASKVPGIEAGEGTEQPIDHLAAIRQLVRELRVEKEEEARKKIARATTEAQERLTSPALSPTRETGIDTEPASIETAVQQLAAKLRARIEAAKREAGTAPGADISLGDAADGVDEVTAITEGAPQEAPAPVGASAPIPARRGSAGAEIDGATSREVNEPLAPTPAALQDAEAITAEPAASARGAFDVTASGVPLPLSVRDDQGATSARSPRLGSAGAQATGDTAFVAARTMSSGELAPDPSMLQPAGDGTLAATHTAASAESALDGVEHRANIANADPGAIGLSFGESAEPARGESPPSTEADRGGSVPRPPKPADSIEQLAPTRRSVSASLSPRLPEAARLGKATFSSPSRAELQATAMPVPAGSGTDLTRPPAELGASGANPAELSDANLRALEDQGLVTPGSPSDVSSVAEEEQGELGHDDALPPAPVATNTAPTARTFGSQPPQVLTGWTHEEAQESFIAAPVRTAMSALPPPRTQEAGILRSATFAPSAQVVPGSSMAAQPGGASRPAVRSPAGTLSKPPFAAPLPEALQGSALPVEASGALPQASLSTRVAVGSAAQAAGAEALSEFAPPPASQAILMGPAATGGSSAGAPPQGAGTSPPPLGLGGTRRTPLVPQPRQEATHPDGSGGPARLISPIRGVAHSSIDGEEDDFRTKEEDGMRRASTPAVQGPDPEMIVTERGAVRFLATLPNGAPETWEARQKRAQDKATEIIAAATIASTTEKGKDAHLSKHKPFTYGGLLTHLLQGCAVDFPNDTGNRAGFGAWARRSGQKPRDDIPKGEKEPISLTSPLGKKLCLFLNQNGLWPKGGSFDKSTLETADLEHLKNNHPEDNTKDNLKYAADILQTLKSLSAEAQRGAKGVFVAPSGDGSVGARSHRLVATGIEPHQVDAKVEKLLSKRREAGAVATPPPSPRGASAAALAGAEATRGGPQ